MGYKFLLLFSQCSYIANYIALIINIYSYSICYNITIAIHAFRPAHQCSVCVYTGPPELGNTDLN